MTATDTIMKSMMGLLYSVLTDGEPGLVEQNERERFINWCLPGIPIDPEDLRFAVRGFTGRGSRRADDVPFRRSFPADTPPPLVRIGGVPQPLVALGGAPLSDGGDPPRGLLPAYITRLVLVRKLQIELDVTPAAPALGTMVQFAVGFRPALLTMLAPRAAAAKATPSPLQLLTRTRDKSQALNLRQFVKMTMSQEPSGKRSLDLRPLGSLAVSFPAPVAFLSRPILDRITAEQGTVAHDLARLTAERTALQGQGAGLEQQVERLEGQVRRYPESVHTVTIRDHRGGGVVRESVLDVDALRRQLADLKRGLQGIQAEMARLDQAVAIQTQQADDLQELQQYYEMLSRAGDDADIFVLGFVCSATPKSPDPDPALFP